MTSWPTVVWDGERERVRKKRINGRISEWKGTFGWIIPEQQVQHEKAPMNQGRIYVKADDISHENGEAWKGEGQRVSFLVYADNRGLGAEECRVRSDEPAPEPKAKKAES